MEKANLLTLIFITADFAICSCPHRQRGAGGGTGEPGKLLSSGEAGPGRPRLARSSAGQGGTSRHPVPTQTPLGKRAAPQYSLGKAVPRHPSAAGVDGTVMLRACAAGWHSPARLCPPAPASSRCPGWEGGVTLGTPVPRQGRPGPRFALPLRISPEPGAQAVSGRLALTARQ